MLELGAWPTLIGRCGDSPLLLGVTDHELSSEHFQ